MQASIQPMVPSTIRTIVGKKAQIFRLADFLREFAPCLDVDFQETPGGSRRHNALMRRLSDTLVSPVGDRLKPLRSTQPGSQESLSTLVDDVIWSLVNQKEKIPNVLSKGYVVASERLEQQVTRCTNMRAGVMCKTLNGNVSFCKTSRYFQILHSMVGDDIVRVLLLRTRMLVPLVVESSEGQLCENYMMLCGPVPKSKRGLLPACPPDVHYLQPSNVEEKSGKRRPRKAISSDSKEESKQPIYDPLSPLAPINRKSLFYSDAYIPKVGLPKTHVLNTTPRCKGILLLEHMIPLRDTPNGRKRRKRWNRLRAMGPSLCTEIIKRHANCDYHRLLEKHCPLPAEVVKRQKLRDEGGNARIEPNMKEQPSQDITLPQLSASHTEADKVIAFLSSIIHTVFPVSFWGSSHNLSRVMETVEVFVKLRRGEELPNKTVMEGIRVTNFGWLMGDGNNSKLSRGGHEATTSLVTMVFRWFFGHFVVPLLRSTFYITESEFAGKTVLFYRKPVWTLFRFRSMQHLLKNQYKEISLDETTERLNNQQMGCSRLRLLPKATGVRPIATLCKREPDPSESTIASNDRVSNRKRPCAAISRAGNSSGSWSDKFKSTNAILGDAFAALKYEHQSKPGFFGSGLLGLQSFYPRYRDFVSKVKERTGSIPKLYFASVDVRHCYDNIDQDRLLHIVMNVLSEDDYMIHRYSQLHANQSTSRVAKKRKIEVGLPETFDVFHKWTSDVTSSCRGAVFLDEANSSLANRDKILALIREHLKSHLVVAKGRYGNRWLLQSKGIPQGSVLSSFLCNFYYGEIERELIALDEECGDGKIANDQHHLLARIIDDFFLITTDQSTHQTFLQAMYKGKPSLGALINRDKVFSNVKVSLRDDTGLVHTIEDATLGRNGMFSWCGMLFDNQSLEVQIDYARFEDDKAGHNLTVARSEEGEHLRKAMKTFVRPRCLPILFDPAINTQATRDANFFDLILLCATKTEKYLEGSGNVKKPLHSNVDFLLSCIEDVILFSLHVIKYRLQHESGVDGMAVDLSQSHAQCLGWNAFLITFDESPRMCTLAPKIEEKLQRYRRDPRVARALRGSPQLKLKKTKA